MERIYLKESFSILITYGNYTEAIDLYFQYKKNADNEIIDLLLQLKAFFWDTLYSTTSNHGPALTLAHAYIHTYEYARLCAYRGGGTHRPPAIFHGILLPSAHATLRARQNARRRRDARFYLSAIYLPTRALPKRGAPTHDPAGDRFEKLLIVLFWIGVPRHSGPPSPSSDELLLCELPPNQTTMAHIGRANLPLSIDSRGFLEKVWIDGCRQVTKS